MINGFNQKSARIEFDENTPVNTRLFALPFQGHDAEINDIRLKSNELSDSYLNEYFQIKSKNLFLKKTYDLDEIQIDLIELLFVCTSVPNPMSGSTSRNTFLLYITINDVNDNAPVFLGTPYKFSIKEYTPVGTIVYQGINAIDRDLPNKPNSQISFTIEPGRFSDYFEFPLTTKSDIAIAKLIQYDIFPKCFLTIRVQDHGTPQLSTSTTIEINIIDIDDKDPIFTRNYYTGIIKRNSIVGAFVNMTSSKINAYDQDTGINMSVKYSLSNNPGNLTDF